MAYYGIKFDINAFYHPIDSIDRWINVDGWIGKESEGDKEVM